MPHFESRYLSPLVSFRLFTAASLSIAHIRTDWYQQLKISENANAVIVFNFNKFKNILQWRVIWMAAHEHFDEKKTENNTVCTGWVSESEKGNEETKEIYTKWWFLVNSLTNEKISTRTHTQRRTYLYISFYYYYLWLMTILICWIGFRYLFLSLSVSIARSFFVRFVLLFFIVLFRFVSTKNKWIYAFMLIS